MKTFVLCSALLTFTVLSSTAGTLTGTQLCWQANTPSPGNPFENCSETSGSDSIHVVTPNPDSTDPLNPLPDQIFDGAAFAIATPDTWKVFLSVSMSDYRRDMYVPYPGQLIPTTAVSTAESADNIMVTGGTGVYSLSYIFSVDGIVQANLGGAALCVTLSLPQGTGSTTSTCYSPGDAIPGTLTLTYGQLPFAGTVDPTLFIQAIWNVGGIDPSDIPLIGADTMTGSALVDFGSTVHLTDVLVTDSNGNPIPGVSITGTSGFQYPLDARNAAAGVPEPCGMAVLGLAMLGWRRTRRRVV